MIPLGNLGKPMKPPAHRAERFVVRLASTLAHTGKIGDLGYPDPEEAVKQVAGRLEAKVSEGDLRDVFKAIEEVKENDSPY